MKENKLNEQHQLGDSKLSPIKYVLGFLVFWLALILGPFIIGILNMFAPPMGTITKTVFYFLLQPSCCYFAFLLMKHILEGKGFVLALVNGILAVLTMIFSAFGNFIYQDWLGLVNIVVCIIIIILSMVTYKNIDSE